MKEEGRKLRQGSVNLYKVLLLKLKEARHCIASRIIKILIRKE
jgi:hypothetical protein